MSTRTRTLLALLVTVSLLLTPVLSASAAGPDGNTPFDVKFSGVITGVPAVAGDAWQIAGQTVMTDANTKITMPEDAEDATGMWASVTAKKQTDGSLLAQKLAVASPEMRLIGPLEAIAEGDLGTWAVAGVDFTVDETTKINDRGEPMMLGDWVEVHAVEDAGTLVAVAIMPVEEQEDIELYGEIQNLADTQWMISSVRFTVSPDTRIMGEPQAGLLAKATLEQDGEELLARTVKVVWDEQGGWRMPVQFTGNVEALPEDGLVGVWTVDGRQVDVAAQTKVVQKKALVEVGATVHVVGWTEGDVVKAIAIAVMAPPAGTTPFQLAGVIEALPADGLTGAWTVSGNEIQVTAATRIAGLQYAQVGAPVTVVGTQRSDGTKTATLIHAKRAR